MNEKKENGFVMRRTEALALVLLSSRPDLTIMSAPANAGVDLIVSIVRQKVNSFNHFGVILKGTAKEVKNLQDARHVLMPLIPPESAHKSLSMPICIFFFSMIGDRGHYSWLRAPVTSEGVPRLRDYADFECKRLDQAALQAIVDDVDSYFDALSRVLVS
jgi:hypothetical protein